MYKKKSCNYISVTNESNSEQNNILKNQEIYLQGREIKEKKVYGQLVKLSPF